MSSTVATTCRGVWLGSPRILDRDLMSLMRLLVDVCRFSQLNDAIHKYVKRAKGSRVNKPKFGEKFERVPVLSAIQYWTRKGGSRHPDLVGCFRVSLFVDLLHYFQLAISKFLLSDTSRRCPPSESASLFPSPFKLALTSIPRRRTDRHAFPVSRIRLQACCWPDRHLLPLVTLNPH